LQPCLRSLSAKSINLSKKPTFLLTKWYLDCVAENGDAVVVYVADLRWDQLSMRYSSLLTVREGRVHCASSLRECLFPQLDGDTTTLSLPHLGMKGTWQALRSPVKRMVFDSEDGSVAWHCHQPMSQVDLLLQGKTRMVGLGYAECLTLSVLPWKLPLEELHWGRFLSRHHALVWIDWRGPQRRRTVLYDGEEQEIQSLTESRMLFADTGTTLDLDRGMVLRSGQLGRTVFAGISRGMLQTGNMTASGWAIHEVVKWK
jgi:hypothetical protein